MSYSLSTLRTFTRRYINEEDNTNSHFTDSEINDYLNQAVQFLGTQMEWLSETATAVSVLNQALYTVPSDFIALVDAYFDETKIMIIERADLGGISPSWQKDPSSTPKYVYREEQDVFGIYPTPDSTQAGKLIQVQYIQLPPTLVNDTDVPDLHSSFQMCLPFYAAFCCEHKLGNDKKSEMNLERYDQHRKALMSKVQKFSDDLMRFRWSYNYPERNT